MVSFSLSLTSPIGLIRESQRVDFLFLRFLPDTTGKIRRKERLFDRGRMMTATTTTRGRKKKGRRKRVIRSLGLLRLSPQRGGREKRTCLSLVAVNIEKKKFFYLSDKTAFVICKPEIKKGE